MNRFDTEILNTRFSKRPYITKQELSSFADMKFRSIDVENGNEVFYLNKRSASWLLDNLRHEDLTERQAYQVKRLSKVYQYTGNKKVWSGKTVKINLNTMKLEDGLIRMYAIAMLSSDNNISVPIDFIGDTYE